MDEVEVVQRLLAAYSPSGHEEAAVRVFTDVARELGYDVRVDAAGNGRASRGTGRPRVVYLGHIDTVEGELPVRRADGRVYGRGACDAKGPLAAALVAGAAANVPGSVEIIACVGEETDSRGARAIAQEPPAERLIGGEPNRWDGIGVAYKGDLRLAAVFDGPRAHLSSPGPSLVEQAIEWVEDLREIGPDDPESAYRSLTVKLAHLTTQHDGDAERVELVVDLRVPPGVTTASIRKRVEAIDGPTSRTVLVEIEPWATERTDPVVRALSNAVRAEGGRPTLWRKGGTSDVNLVASAWKRPCAVYGPGDPHLDHTADESIEEAELRRSVRVLTRAFAELGQHEPPASAAAPRPH